LLWQETKKKKKKTIEMPRWLQKEENTKTKTLAFAGHQLLMFRKTNRLKAYPTTDENQNQNNLKPPDDASGQSQIGTTESQPPTQ
jgi:hypothetical protein